MKYKEKYIINFNGLKDGKHSFQFKLDNDFLKHNPLEDVFSLDIDSVVEMVKTIRNLSFDIHLTGTMNIQCDRCLGKYDHRIEYNTKLYVNFGEKTSDLLDIDESMILSRHEDKFEFSKHFYDYVSLLVPLKKIHPLNKKEEHACNLEMIFKIEELNGFDNKENISDPRWGKLNNLFN